MKYLFRKYYQMIQIESILLQNNEMYTGSTESSYKCKIEYKYILNDLTTIQDSTSPSPCAIGNATLCDRCPHRRRRRNRGFVR